MVPLINKRDNLFLRESEFPSSAMFYKDMIAFCDAYNKFVGYGVKRLPNYCYINNKVYLDGMCLLIKDYCSEFDFETLDLTLDYLKVLYYACASFSVDGNFPEKSIIEDKFEEKKYLNRELYDKTAILAESAQTIYDAALNKFEIQTAMNDKNQFKAKFYSKISFIFLIVNLVLSVLFETLGFVGGLSKMVGIPIAVAFLILAILTFTFCRIKMNKHLKEIESKQKETIILTEDKNEKLEKLKEIIERKNRINNEKYNFIYCINNLDLLNDNTNYQLILEIATQYNMLSYNLEYDVSNAFEKHDKDIKEMVKQISQFSNNDDLFENLNNCYLDIVRKNWLYYNRFVRYSFIEKMIICANKTHNWQIHHDGKFIDPFNINIKSIAEEKTAFLQNEDSLFVEMPINRIFKVESVKQDKSLRIKIDASLDEIKSIKMAYANKFYKLSEVKKLTGVFYSENQGRENKNKTIDMVLLDSKNVIPDLFLIKTNLIEARKKFEDSHLPVIGELSEKILLLQDNQDDDTLFEYESEGELINFVEYLDLKDVVGSNVTCEDITENDDGSVEYYFDGKKLIGYKL